MPAKAILTLLFLVSLGAAVIVCLHALPQRLSAEGLATRDEILVATTALPSGTLLRAKDVAWQPLDRKAEPAEIRRPRGAIDNPNDELERQARSEVYGAALRNDVAPGDPIRRSVIVKPGDRDFLQVVLSPGARAIAIPVATGGAGTGLLYPGDRVDVILTQTFKNDPPPARGSVSETVVESLRVLSVDPTDPKSAGAGSGFGRTVTLEVTHEQAEKINVAAELGKLSLALRSLSTNGSTHTAVPASGAMGNLKSTWAGDVSPALSDAATLYKVIAAERPVVEVIHGTKTVTVKLQ
jgi:pilus assembly protein CpaB